MQTQSSDENSVCLPVKRLHCDKTEETAVQIFIPYERLFSLVFWEEEWLVAATLIPEVLGQPAPVGAKSPQRGEFKNAKRPFSKSHFA